MDEFATHKGQKYLTAAVNLETAEILHADKSKGAGALIPTTERLKRVKVPLKAVAMVMSEAYSKAVRDVYDVKADVVLDIFGNLR